MTKPERDKLRQLASEATPGPWKHDYGNGEVECEHDDYWRMSIVSRASYGRHEEDSWKRPGKLINPNDDCEYIAAVNPSVITQLLDQLDEYEKALQFYVESAPLTVAIDGVVKYDDNGKIAKEALYGQRDKV